ncbi:MAG TPA: histidine phosphatase family protein [Leucothrix sp.]|nr:histidine phosphatase family protein [Leucothrix sp.]
MNHLEKLKNLKNRYFVMRHGQSMANLGGLIVSTPENGVTAYGLSDEGKEQVRKSVLTRKWLDIELASNVRIISSDFKRAHETAKIASAKLKTTHKVLLNSKLRERDFGDFELQSDTNYQKTWADDAISSAHTNNNVESADSVMQRATSLVISLEEKYSAETFLLIAHGDTLQILQTAFKKQPASKQRELTHLETAEIRELILS